MGHDGDQARDEVVDRWARWLLQGRHGGDEATHERMLAMLAPIRDRLLDAARLQGPETVLDLGCGDGLIGFGALERLDDRGRVIFTDVSADLLDRCRRIAADLGEHRCRFERASADRLESIADASVDVVTCRSVLIYLDRDGKRRALAEAARVLRPGGRLSLFEPINRFGFPEPKGRLLGYDVAPIPGPAGKLRATMADAAASSPLLDFDERDLFAWAEQAGFGEIHLTLEAEHAPAGDRAPTRGWDALLGTAGNPLMPTLGQLIDTALTASEADELEAHLRPLVEAGAATVRLATTHLDARR
ncbi:MAG: class I SAM-dependent methyltransferase [Solirubrobacteraceae bacterium]|nr:class I SAM-dependent methyltransferase [Solirubrobacteraceae bacterium]